MSRSFRWAVAPILCSVTPLFAQSYYPQPQQPLADYTASDDQRDAQAGYGEDRGYAAPPRYQPQYQQRPDAPPPGYYRQQQQQPPQGYAPYGYYQPEPQRRPAYADNNGGAPRAPYARYDYGRQSDYYGSPDYGRRPVYAPRPPEAEPQPQPQPRAPEPQPVAEAPVAPPVAAPAPVASAPVASVPIDPLDVTTWEAAKRANSAQAFTTYLDRFPNGAHAQEAEGLIDQLQRDAPPEPAVAVAAPAAAAASVKLASAPVVTPAIKGLPIHAVDTAPVPVAPAAIADATPAKPVPAPAPVAAVAAAAPTQTAFLCRPAFQGAVPYDQADAAEIAAYLQATRLNSIAAYQAYVAAYPHGTFTAEVQDVISARQGRMSQLAAAGLAPATAHARAKVTLTAADYPSVALRDGQQGTAVASWEVAEDGCVESCKIDRSSGSSALDAATCNVITERGRYDPTVGTQGKPVRSMETAQLTWNLPQH